MASANPMLTDYQSDHPVPLVVSTATDINGSVSADTIVQKNRSLHVWGNLVGSLTIEPGANVVVDGFVHGKIINRGGRLVVDHTPLQRSVIRRHLAHLPVWARERQPR